jgi:hypothetical protein
LRVESVKAPWEPRSFTELRASSKERRSEDGDKKMWHISSEQGAKSDELSEDGRWEIEDGD